MRAPEELLLVAHRKAGLWLPSCGHVEPMRFRGSRPGVDAAKSCVLRPCSPL
ncbi:hypothetical protein JOF59_004075 [Streptomyces clavifer]|uniref:Uncharacterized protein n=1 Tax=Streptomyces clavifer TaxID=68188 RepID=A0ABS4VCR7_9ACTN|nr:hypothetical protein [Streptomyces clavifer]